MAKGKIVLLPFPFDDLASIKVRPAMTKSYAKLRKQMSVEAQKKARIKTQALLQALREMRHNQKK